MRTLPRLLVLALFGYLLHPAPALGQVITEGTAVIEVQGYGAIWGVAHQCPIRANGRIEGYVGQFISCPVWAIDADSFPTPATITAAVVDTTRIAATVEGDSLLHIEILRRGNTRIELTATPYLFLAMIYPDRAPPYEALDTLPPFKVYGLEAETEPAYLCAYEGGYSNATGMGVPPGGNSVCPTFGAASLRYFPIEWRMGTGQPAYLEAPHPLAFVAMD